MTTLVVLPTKDAVVMGCDSLATVARPMIDPRRLFEEYFDSNGSLKTNSDGKPLLHNVEKALEVSLEVPIDHMTDVDKLFSLEPLQMGAMFTGITAIGDRIPGISASWGDFSEQNAIDCVAYFVRIMREAQRFSARMPTVGGAIHVALVDREMGFRFISRREYSHEDHRVHRDGTKVEATQERGSEPASVSTDRGSLSEFGGNQATQRGSIRARAGC